MSDAYSHINTVVKNLKKNSKYMRVSLDIEHSDATCFVSCGSFKETTQIKL